MLIYCKQLKHQIYDYIRSSVDNALRIIPTTQTDSIDRTLDEDIIINAIPIKYNDNYWILSNLANLQISSLDLTGGTYEIKYIVNEEVNGTIIIRKVCSLHELNLKEEVEDIDCFYDEHINIMFIKFQDTRIDYLDIEDNKLLNFDEYESTNLLFSWINNSLEKNTIVSSNNKIVFEDKFLNLPPIPYIVSSSRVINELADRPMITYPCSGSSVFNNEGEFAGIVSYVTPEQIITIPLMLIRRSLKYMEEYPLYKFNYELNPVKIILKNALGVEITEYGMLYKKKEEHEEIRNVILSIDEHQITNEGELLVQKKSVPVSTYFWLFKKERSIKIKGISSTSLKDIRIHNSNDQMTIDCRHVENLRFSNYNMKLSNKYSDALSVSKLNFVKYKNTCLIEINEKIMQMLKIIIMNSDIFDELYDYINENKFSSRKIVVAMNDSLNVQIIQKIKNTAVINLDTIIKYYKTENALKKYIGGVFLT
jgi:hypothetical protein